MAIEVNDWVVYLGREFQVRAVSRSGRKLRLDDGTGRTRVVYAVMVDLVGVGAWSAAPGVLA